MIPPIFTQSAREQRADAQLDSQYVRATNCYKLSDYFMGKELELN